MATTTNCVGGSYGEGTELNFETDHSHLGYAEVRHELRTKIDGRAVTHLGYSLSFRNADEKRKSPNPDQDYIDKIIKEVRAAFSEAGITFLKEPVQSTEQGTEFAPSATGGSRVLAPGWSDTKVTFRLPLESHSVAKALVLQIDRQFNVRWTQTTSTLPRSMQAPLP